MGGWRGRRRVLSPLALLSSCQHRVLVPAAVRLVLRDRQGPSCQTQGLVRQEKPCFLSLQEGAPGALTPRPQASSFVGWVRIYKYLYIYPLGQEKEENVHIIRTRACVPRRAPCRAVACGVQAMSEPRKLTLVCLFQRYLVSSWGKRS